MRKGLFWVVGAVGLVSAVIACGGGNKQPDGPKHPDTTPAGSASGAGSAAPISTGAAPSTTLATEDAGAGTKLAEAPKDAGASKDGGHTADPGRSVADIQARVAANRDAARACYDEGLKAHPGIEGDLTVKFVIDPKGVVSEVTVDAAKTRILDDGVQKCVMNVIKGLKFPESPRGFETRASYPFNFHPKGKP
ncbi:MAG: AgmX/PglI C-terminal domain-containing protein [Myxococcales bacterium]|jgi:outer membrane biosynthesis protein TonB|nr:AgmX/PglI C-terminal domain-containing protein [Myxococcales bacterium]